MRWTTSLLACLALLPSAEAQDPTLVTAAAAFVPDCAEPGAEVTLRVTLDIAAGYHIYGGKHSLPTEVKLEALGGLVQKGAASIPDGKAHEAFGETSYWLEGAPVLRQVLTVPATLDAGKVTVRGQVDYMACDENSCQPPASAPFTAVLTVAPTQDNGRLKLTAAFEPASGKPGDTVTLVLTATVEDGWHAYGKKETTNIPVAFDLAKQQFGGLVPNGAADIPPGDKHEVFGMQQYPLPNVFQVRQKLVVPGDAKPGEIAVRGALDYQVCDPNMCEPPDAAKYRAKLIVEAAPVVAPPPQDNGRVKLTAAFEPASAKPGDTVTLVLTATVEDGWHAYGQKETGNIPVSFDPAQQQFGGLVPSGAAEIPPGEKHEVLGMEQYPLPSPFQVKQKLVVPADAKADFTVRGALDYQVCDENSCEPPEQAHYAATLLVQPANGSGIPAAGQKPAEVDPKKLPGAMGGTLPGAFGAGAAKLTLSASFEPATARAGEKVTLVLTGTVVDGWHAYGTREETNLPVKFEAKKQQFGALQPSGAAVIPPGEKHTAAWGDQYPLPNPFRVTQQLTVPADAKPGDLAVHGALDYQLCDANSCDPPAEATYTATLKVEAGAAAASAKKESSISWWALVLLSIGGGLFALAMPCTYPMIPITFSFFTKQAEKRHGKVLPLALMYGFGIVLMFTMIGVGVATVISATDVTDIVNHWLTNSIIGAVFLLFAFVLFGWINLQPPAALQQIAGNASRAGGLVGVFFMGAALVVSSFTCTAPIVGSLLANVASYGADRVIIGMAVFGATMAVPFVFLSLVPNKVKELPRAGEWMETLKVSLGFVELAAALKFVSMVDFALAWGILPRELFLMLWSAIFVLWALYLFGVLRKKGHADEGVSNGRMATGMLVFLLAAYFLFGALGYKLDFIMTNFVPGYSAELVVSKAGGGEAGGNGGEKAHVGKHTIVLDDNDKAIALARAQKKLLLYNFTGFN